MKFKYKNYALCMILCPAALFIPHVLRATGVDIRNEVMQTSTITGVVKDTSGEPLAGVNIVVKGTTNGSITDPAGRFVLEASGGSVLLVSYIGFKSKEITVRGQELNITLEEDSEALDEVVVVGYGVQKKSDITGSLSSVKGEELTRLSISRADQALQGKWRG